MPGHPAIATHFWPLLLITSQMTGSVVNISIIIIEPLITFLPEELLIDFQELIGQHSGENMAAVVWSTLETYNIQDKVLSKQSPSCNLLSDTEIIAVMMDNASNNDTLMTVLESKCWMEGIKFSATDARMRCMPHTIHLAAIKVLFNLMFS
jgi:hypothetical protein